MDTEASNHATLDSLKRKRGLPDEDTTPGPERGGSQKKRDSTKSDTDGGSSAITATSNTTDELIHASGTGMSAYLADTNLDNAGTDSISSDTNTASDDKANIQDEPQWKPSLQTIPRELRDMIYGFVAPTEERIVLGRRMVDTRRNNSAQTLYECFKEAIALHPFSMTCRQFRDEFQKVHTADSEAYWILVVNNFDLEQLEHFSDFIRSDEYIEVVGIADGLNLPIYNHNVSLRFQMDESAQYSASQLCKHVYHERKGMAPDSLAHWSFMDITLGMAEIATQYVPRIAAPVANRQSMTIKDATNIEMAFDKLRKDVKVMPDYEVYVRGERFDNTISEIPRTFEYMKFCWFDEFAHCAELMRESPGSHPSPSENFGDIRKIIEDDRRYILESAVDDGLQAQKAFLWVQE